MPPFGFILWPQFASALITNYTSIDSATLPEDSPMGLWDALSGKIYRWNMAKKEACHQMCVKLADQSIEKDGGLARRCVYCAQQATEVILNSFLFSDAGKQYHHIIGQVNGTALNTIISTFAYHYFSRMYFDYEVKNGQTWSFICYCLEMTTEVFNRPEELCKTWILIAGTQEKAAIDREFTRQLSPLIRFDGTDIVHSGTWLFVADLVHQHAFRMYNDPRIEEAIKTELAAQLQLAHAGR